MHVMVTGAAGMVGRKFVERLAAEPLALGAPVTKLTLVDVVSPLPPPALSDLSLPVAADFADAGVIAGLVATRPDLVVHLAAVVSGEAEANFDKGYRINLDGVRNLLEAIRHDSARGPAYVPKLVAASSIAVFGAPFPEKIDDEFFSAPLTS